jgi:hypothetical protein
VCVPQVLYSIPGADITNNPSLLATFVLNLIFIFGLLVRPSQLATSACYVSMSRQHVTSVCHISMPCQHAN